MSRSAPSHNSSSLVASILNPSLARKPASKSDVNHTARNRAALKQAQLQNREISEKKRHEEENKEVFKMARFRNVTSQVKERLAATNNNSNANTRNANFLKKGARATRPTSAVQRDTNSAVPRSTKAALPSREELEDAASRVEAIRNRESRNFVSANAREAVNTKPPELSSADAARHHSDFGQLPKYLVDRKAEFEAAAVAKEIEKNKSKIKIPPGMKLLSEEERIQTLEILKKNLSNLENQLERFPLAVDTMSRKKAKSELEGKIKEIEQAIELFSRKIVFISE